jgi:hypothetical protein
VKNEKLLNEKLLNEKLLNANDGGLKLKENKYFVRDMDSGKLQGHS